MQKTNNLISILSFISISLLMTQNTLAQKFDNSYRDWSVYTGVKEGYKLCYMVSYPKRKTGNYRSRGEPYVMVTSIAGQAVEISVTGGYPYKKSTEPRLIIDGVEHRLSVTKDETAWFKTDHFDAIAIDKMKKGYKLVVKGTSKKGTYSIDTYSLSGFTKAYQRMKKLCR